MLKASDRFGDYTVVKLLGKGGMGAVYLLENAEGVQVAAKNVSRCLESGVDVVFVAHTPNDVRERLLENYGLRFNRMTDGVALEGVCPGLRDMPTGWRHEEAHWQRLEIE